MVHVIVIVTCTVIKCTCERCGHTWDVPDGQRIQRCCPSKACRSPLWDKPITRQGASDFARAARRHDCALLAAKAPASDMPDLTISSMGRYALASTGSMSGSSRS